MEWLGLVLLVSPEGLRRGNVAAPGRLSVFGGSTPMTAIRSTNAKPLATRNRSSGLMPAVYVTVTVPWSPTVVHVSCALWIRAMMHLLQRHEPRERTQGYACVIKRRLLRGKSHAGATYGGGRSGHPDLGPVHCLVPPPPTLI